MITLVCFRSAAIELFTQEASQQDERMSRLAFPAPAHHWRPVIWCWPMQGDNNRGDDRVLYSPGQKWLNQKHIMGRVVGCAPWKHRHRV